MKITSLLLLLSSILLSFPPCISSTLKGTISNKYENEGFLRHKHNASLLSQSRYLTLGSTTNPSYQTILSPNITNLSILTNVDNSPLLSSLCTNSLLKNDIYDVIILDYTWDINGLDILAKRLRQRYPNAFIILNIMWIPKLILATDINNNIYTFDELLERYNVQIPISNDDINTISKDIINFKLNPEVKDRINQLKTIKNSINGHLFALDQYSSVYWDSKPWVLNRLSLFHDGTHYNDKGYGFIANGIKEVLIKIQPDPSNTVGTINHNEDFCNVWYNTGKVSVKYHPREAFTINEFTTGKFALEIPVEGGLIGIHNHSPDSQQLLLSYMSGDGYSKLEIKMDHGIDTSFIIDPTIRHSGYGYQDGDVVITTNVDLVPRGRTIIHMKPICETTCTPFRLVGLSITDVTYLPINFDHQQPSFPKPAHLLWGKPEEIIPINDRIDDNEIRYASFGSSVTWGASLEDREKECYVWKLSNLDHERGKNFAIRSSGPGFPASCTSSMMKDEEFDVIILEFFMRATDGLKTLATRIRERFPNAIIIILKLWGPYQFYSRELGITDLSKWAFQNGFGDDYIHDPKFEKAFVETGVHKWLYRFDDSSMEAHVRYQRDVAQEIGAYLVKMPFNDYATGPGGWLELGHKLLASDSFHLSAAGHQSIADEIKAIVDRVGISKNKVIKPFAVIDQCYNWFTSGVIGDGIQYSPNGVVAKMTNTEKFVLSFTKGDEENWIRVNNPTDVELEFLIGYMTTGPAPSKYPKVEAIRDNGDRYELLPDSLGYGERNVHIVRIAKLGTVDGHSSTQVKFVPLEETEYPFRLVQVILTPLSDNNDERTESLTSIGMMHMANTN